MTSRRTLALAALGIALCAAPAFAADDLNIFPDLIEDWFAGGDQWSRPWTSTWVQLVVLFVLIVLPLNALLFKPLLRTLEQRGEKIEGARERASALSKQAEQVLGIYEAAVGVARRQAENVRREALELARGEQTRIGVDARRAAEQEIAQARASVAGATESARAALRGETQRLARDVAAKVLGRPLA